MGEQVIRFRAAGGLYRPIRSNFPEMSAVRSLLSVQPPRIEKRLHAYPWVDGWCSYCSRYGSVAHRAVLGSERKLAADSGCRRGRWSGAGSVAKHNPSHSEGAHHHATLRGCRIRHALPLISPALAAGTSAPRSFHPAPRPPCGSCSTANVRGPRSVIERLTNRAYGVPPAEGLPFCPDSAGLCKRHDRQSVQPA